MVLREEATIKRLYSFTKIEMKILNRFNMVRGETDSGYLSELCSVNLSTSQRALKKFIDLKLCTQRKVNNKKGGYCFFYKPLSSLDFYNKVKFDLKIEYNNIINGLE